MGAIIGRPLPTDLGARPPLGPPGVVADAPTPEGIRPTIIPPGETTHPGVGSLTIRPSPAETPEGDCAVPPANVVPSND
jgi:hypothetical protein